MPATILVVDDEPDMEILVRQRFRKEVQAQELSFVFAHNGIQALKKLQEMEEIDLVLTDINMPEMDGLTLLAHIRSLNVPLKTVIVSAYDDMENIRTAMNRGASDFLTKPIDFVDLEATLHKTLQEALAFKWALFERQRAEEALRESERRLTQFLEAVPVGVFVMDAGGKPYYANQAAQQILGKGIAPDATPDQLAEVYQAYLAGTDRKYPTDQMPIVQALRRESSTVDDMEIHTPDRIIPLEVWARPIFDKDGTVVYAIAAFQDITGRRRAEQISAEYNRTLEREVAQRTQELQEATRRKSAFLASMSHELRTPMNAIKGFTSLVLRREPSLTDRGKQNLEKVGQASDHLLAMINDLLDLSKIEAGKMDVNVERFDVKALVASCCDTVSPLVLTKDGLELRQEISADASQAHTDQVRLRQMVINLLSNAIKFTDAGSVTVRARQADGQLMLAVTDTGRGIPAEDLPAIFDEYRQVRGHSESAVQRGTGLGLSITKRFAELLGGTISAESQVGKGSTFTVRIPVIFQKEQKRS